MDSRYEERRRYLRYLIKAKATLKTKAPEPRIINGDLADISFSGFSCSSQEKIEPGTDVHFEISTRFFTQPLTGEGKVKNIKAQGGSFFRVGVEFVDVDKDILQSALTALQRIVASEKLKKAKFKRQPSQSWGF